MREMDDLDDLDDMDDIHMESRTFSLPHGRSADTARFGTEWGA
ncbi:hypothetical protein [Sphingomonas changbaiensis]|nr:hypothetical protein [Sphingomonas changbaiensis]